MGRRGRSAGAVGAGRCVRSHMDRSAETTMADPDTYR